MAIISYSQDKREKIEAAEKAIAFLDEELENGMYVYLKDAFDRLALLIETERSTYNV